MGARHAIVQRRLWRHACVVTRLRLPLHIPASACVAIHPYAVTVTDSDGNKFDLKKLPGKDGTETIRFKSMYVKGGAPPSAAPPQLPRLPCLSHAHRPDATAQSALRPVRAALACVLGRSRVRGTLLHATLLWTSGTRARLDLAT